MAQEALYRAWENLEQLEDPQRADRWLFSIAANLMRTKGRSPAAEPLRDEHHPICESAEEHILKKENARLIASLLEELPHPQRQAIYGRYVLGCSPSQLAEILNVSPHAISARLYRGLKELRKKWRSLR